MARPSRNNQLFVNSTANTLCDGDFIDLTSENCIDEVVDGPTEAPSDPLNTDQSESNDTKEILNSSVSIIPLVNSLNSASTTHQKILIPLRIENSNSTGQYLLIDKSQVQQQVNVLGQGMFNSGSTLTKINLTNPTGETPTIQSKRKQNIIIHDHVKVTCNNMEFIDSEEDQTMKKSLKDTGKDSETTRATNISSNNNVKHTSSISSVNCINKNLITSKQFEKIIPKSQASSNLNSLQTKPAVYTQVTKSTYQNMQELLKQVRQGSDDGKIILIGLPTSQLQAENSQEETPNETVDLSHEELPKFISKAARRFRSLPVTLSPEELESLTNRQKALAQSYCHKVNNSITIADPLDDQASKPAFRRPYSKPTARESAKVPTAAPLPPPPPPPPMKKTVPLAKEAPKPARVIPVDISKILQKGAQPMPPARCKSFHSKKNVHVRGFTSQEKRMPGCFKQMKRAIAEEEKELQKLRDALAARETAFVRVRSRPADFLPEVVELDSDEDDLQAEVYKSRTLPAINEVISDVHEEMMQLKRRRSETLAKPEAALRLIKEGLELIQSWSKETCLAKEAPGKRRGRAKEGAGASQPKKRRGRRRNAVGSEASQTTVRVEEVVECPGASDDELLIVKKVDILNERRVR